MGKKVRDPVCPVCGDAVQGSMGEHQYWSEACNSQRLYTLGFIGWPQAQALAARTCAERRLAAELFYMAATRSTAAQGIQHISPRAAEAETLPTETPPEKNQKKIKKRKSVLDGSTEPKTHKSKRKTYRD